MPAVGVLKVLTDPRLDVGDLWEGVAGRLLAGVELCEANTEADLVDIGVGDQVVGCGGNGGVDEELQQALCGQTPALGVAVNEGLRLAESLGKRYYGSLAVSRPGKLLSVWQDDCEVDGFEDTVLLLVRCNKVCCSTTYSCWT